MGTYGHQGGYAFNEDQRGGHHPGIFEMSAEIDRLTQRLAESEADYLEATNDAKHMTMKSCPFASVLSKRSKTPQRRIG
jgi:hypothetical protein